MSRYDLNNSSTLDWIEFATMVVQDHEAFRINLSSDQQRQLKARVQTARVARDNNKERGEALSPDNDAGPLRAGDRVAVTDLGAPQEGREGMLRGVVRLSGGEERCIVDLDVLEPSPAEIHRSASLPLDEATHLFTPMEAPNSPCDPSYVANASLVGTRSGFGMLLWEPPSFVAVTPRWGQTSA